MRLKRLTAILLCLCMALTLLPTAALAADEGQTIYVGDAVLTTTAENPTVYARTDSSGTVTPGGSEDSYNIKWDGATLTLKDAAIQGAHGFSYTASASAAIYRTGLPVSYHDFFVVEKEEGIYISFELELKGPCDKSDEEMYQMILTEILKSNPKYFIEMMVDRNFISGKVYGKSGIEHPAE